VRLAQSLVLTAGASPTGSAIFFDDENLYYMGHSQGSTTGVPFAALESGVQGAVFSGAGGWLIQSLLNKSLPYDLPAAISVGLADPDLDRWHPLLNIVQAGAERSDAVNHGRLLITEPAAGAMHVFQTYGLGDSYTPDQTQYALVRSMGVSQVTNGNEALDWVPTVTAPVTGNRSGGTITGVVGLYEAAEGRDAHFVMFDRDDANKQATHFLATAVLDGTPTVVSP